MGNVVILQRRTKKARAAAAEREAQRAAGLTEKKLIEFKLISLYQLIYALMLERDDPHEQVSFEMDSLMTLNPKDVIIEKHPDPRVGPDGKQRAKIVVSLADAKPE